MKTVLQLLLNVSQYEYRYRPINIADDRMGKVNITFISLLVKSVTVKLSSLETQHRSLQSKSSGL